jgi:tetratricopeptide (TPR) repeat protein
MMNQDENKQRRDLMHARAICLVQTQRPSDARQLFLKLTEGDEGAADYDAWLGLARLSVTLRDLPRLREASNRLVSIDPKRQEGFVLRAIHQRKSGDFDGAYESLTKALAIRQDPEALVLLGLVERDTGHSEGARAAFAKAVELDPSNQSAAQLLGTMTAQAGTETDQ